MKLHTNVKQHERRAEHMNDNPGFPTFSENACRHMNHKSGFPTFGVIALCVLTIFVSTP